MGDVLAFSARPAAGVDDVAAAVDDHVNLLLEAAGLMRERLLAAPAGRWTEQVLGSEGYAVRAAAVPVGSRGAERRPTVARCGMEKWETDRASAEHIASWDPPVALAIAEWLEKVADHHRPELVDGLYFTDCDECPAGDDCDGHERWCCWSCTTTSDEYWSHVLYPCQVMRDATAIAETYLRKVVDDA